MVGSIATERASRALEFGLYRDGDNNLDDVQALVIGQALQTSKNDGSIEFTIEDTTSRRGFEPADTLRTESYTIADGHVHVGRQDRAAARHVGARRSREIRRARARQRGSIGCQADVDRPRRSRRR